MTPARLHLAAFACLLPAFLCIACEKAVVEPGSLEIRLKVSDLDGVTVEAHARLVRLENGRACAFEALERADAGLPGTVRYNAVKLRPARYRIHAAWAEYLWAGPMEGAARPLPEIMEEFNVQSGHAGMELDLRYGHGVFLSVLGLPPELENCVHIRVSSDGGNGVAYDCRLGRLPAVSRTGRKGFFLPLVQGVELEIEVSGPMPGWKPVAKARTALDPEWLEFPFPDCSFGSLDIEMFYTSGEPVKGFLSVQSVEWNRPFADDAVKIEMEQKGRGRRLAAGLPEGRYRVYFTWFPVLGVGEGCEELLEIEVKGEVKRRLDINPALVTYETRGLRAGGYTARLRRKGGSRVVSRRSFNVPGKADPYSLVFQPGDYVAELYSEEGKILYAPSIRIQGNEPLRVQWY
jgi:hypothetical protein